MAAETTAYTARVYSDSTLMSTAGAPAPRRRLERVRGTLSLHFAQVAARARAMALAELAAKGVVCPSPPAAVVAAASQSQPLAAVAAASQSQPLAAIAAASQSQPLAAVAAASQSQPLAAVAAARSSSASETSESEASAAVAVTREPEAAVAVEREPGAGVPLAPAPAPSLSTDIVPPSDLTPPPPRPSPPPLPEGGELWPSPAPAPPAGPSAALHVTASPLWPLVLVFQALLEGTEPLPILLAHAANRPEPLPAAPEREADDPFSPPLPHAPPPHATAPLSAPPVVGAAHAAVDGTGRPVHIGSVPVESEPPPAQHVAAPGLVPLLPVPTKLPAGQQPTASACLPAPLRGPFHLYAPLVVRADQPVIVAADHTAPPVAGLPSPSLETPPAPPRAAGLCGGKHERAVPHVIMDAPLPKRRSVSSPARVEMEIALWAKIVKYV